MSLNQLISIQDKFLLKPATLTWRSRLRNFTATIEAPLREIIGNLN